MSSLTLLNKIFPKGEIKRKKSPDERVREALQKSLDDMVSDLEKRAKENEGEREDRPGE